MEETFGTAVGQNIIRIPVMIHIRNRIIQLEKATNGVACLQFAQHPEGLSMVVRIFLPASEKEFVYPDCILSCELIKRDKEYQRIDVLFDCIHEALDSVQVVQDVSGGLIHH
jgi:hypothetical protein